MPAGDPGPAPARPLALPLLPGIGQRLGPAFSRSSPVEVLGGWEAICFVWGEVPPGISNGHWPSPLKPGLGVRVAGKGTKGRGGLVRVCEGG